MNQYGDCSVLTLDEINAKIKEQDTVYLKSIGIIIIKLWEKLTYST